MVFISEIVRSLSAAARSNVIRPIWYCFRCSLSSHEIYFVDFIYLALQSASASIQISFEQLHQSIQTFVVYLSFRLVCFLCISLVYFHWGVHLMRIVERLRTHRTTNY